MRVASMPNRSASVRACPALVVATAAPAGASRQVSRSNQPRRSTGRHARSGTQAGADHQPYSCTVATTGEATRSGSNPIQGENRNAEGANCTCTRSGRHARSRRTALTSPETGTGRTASPASDSARTRWSV